MPTLVCALRRMNSAAAFRTVDTWGVTYDLLTVRSLNKKSVVDGCIFISLYLFSITRPLFLWFGDRRELIWEYLWPLCSAKFISMLWVVFSFPGSRFPGARDSRPFSFPDSRELKRRHSREKRERVKDNCSLNEMQDIYYSAFKRQLLVISIMQYHAAIHIAALQLAGRLFAFLVTSRD